MILGFCGSHRVGKTTIARSMAAHLGLAFKPTSVSGAQVWKDAHMTPSEQVTFAERVILQGKILDHMNEVVKGDGVYDRTFVDLIGYLYANVDRTSSNLLNPMIQSFVSQCLYLTKLKFDKIIIIQPGIKVVEDEAKIGKTYLSDPYIDAINNHIVATAYNYMLPSDYIIVPRDVTSVSDRVEFVSAALGDI